jgi:hypothetical protein
MLQNIKEQLVALKLHGMAEALDMQLRTPMAAEMDFAGRLLLMVQQEKSARENRQLTTLLRQGRLLLRRGGLPGRHQNRLSAAIPAPARP